MADFLDGVLRDFYTSNMPVEARIDYQYTPQQLEERRHLLQQIEDEHRNFILRVEPMIERLQTLQAEAKPVYVVKSGLR